MDNTLLGIRSINDFMPPTTFSYPTGSMIVNNTAEQSLTEQNVIDIIMNTLASLNKDGAYPLQEDNNPLDNIVRNEVIKLLSFRKLDQPDIKRAIDLHERGLDASHGMSVEEHVLLLNQAREIELLTQAEYMSLESKPSMFWYNYPDKYMKILEFQLYLPTSIPTSEELINAGVEKIILETIKNNQDYVIDKTIIDHFTRKYIDETLLKTEFIGYSNANSIYKDPIYLTNILDKQVLTSFMLRVKPYLPFLTDEVMNKVLNLLPSEFAKVTNYLSLSQIRLMVDKELDIKNLILKTLTLEEVNKTFNNLAEQFKTDFTNTFTQEKLIELISVTIQKIFPIPSTEEIYQQLATLFNISISQEKIIKIENYLTNY